MAQPVDVQRKLRQLDNDVRSIYQTLAAIAGTQTRHSNRFDELGATLDEHSRTLDGHSRTLDGHSRTLDEHGRTLDAHGDVLDRIDVKLDRILGMVGDGPG